MPDISVLMPCRDAGRYLRSSVDSAVGQLAAGDELVVQDACSTDGSAELLDAAAAADPRVVVDHERDAGQSDALNRALRRARGELIGWLNADDLLLPGGLAAVRAAVAAHGHLPQVVVGGWQLIGADDQVLRTSAGARLVRGRALVLGCYAFSGAIFIRRDVLTECGGFATGLHYVMDYDLLLRLAGLVTDQVVIAEPVAALRYHSTSKSGSAGREFFREGLTVRWRGVRTPGEIARAVAGSAVHGVGVATARMRLSPTYSQVRRKIRFSS